MRAARIAALLCACAAACSLYGEDEPSSPAPVGVDASSSAPDATGDEAPVLLNDDAFAPASDGAPADAAADRAAAKPDLFVFVTRDTISAKMSASKPEDIADAFCAKAAANGPRLGNRKFVAWLGTPSKAHQRVLGQAGRRYVRLDGVVVTEDPPNMTKGISNPINVDELNAFVSNVAEVWTGLIGTTNGPDTCLAWSTDDPSLNGTTGTMFTSVFWSTYSTRACNTPRHLYCFEVP